MKILLVAAAVALAIGQDPSPPTVMEDSRTSPHHDNSLLFTLLQQAGFSQSCVAGALDQCSSPENKSPFASLMEEIKGMAQQIILLLKTWISPPRHCKDLLDSGDRGRGLRQVYPNPDRPHHRVTIYCDHIIDGGGWTVFQRRSSNSTRQDFNRTWVEYQLGFGDLDGEFWVGLDLLHELTSTAMQELRVDLDDYEGGHRWAKYGLFHVGSQDTNYRLSVGRYVGDAGDSIKHSNGGEFSTHDADHNTHSDEYCGKKYTGYSGGWWYKSCGWANLNGYQHVGNFSAPFGEGIIWHNFRGWKYSLRRTTMMVRPATF